MSNVYYYILDIGLPDFKLYLPLTADSIFLLVVLLFRTITIIRVSN